MVIPFAIHNVSIPNKLTLFYLLYQYAVTPTNASTQTPIIIIIADINTEDHSANSTFGAVMWPSFFSNSKKVRVPNS